MNVLFRSSFQRDLKRIKDDTVLEMVRETILQVENVLSLQDIGTSLKFRAMTDIIESASAHIVLAFMLPAKRLSLYGV